jgi:hypothetical protein
MPLLQSVRLTVDRSASICRTISTEHTGSKSLIVFKADCSFAKRIKEAGDLLDTCVIGWDSLNEPDEGFIGVPIKDELPASQDFLKGPCPTPLQMLRLGYGQAVSGIQDYDFTSFGAKKLDKITITPPDGLGVWMTRDEARAAETRWGWKMGQEWDFWEQDGSGGCIWAGHDV